MRAPGFDLSFDKKRREAGKTQVSRNEDKILR